jgi:para-nitrobenzyl esterase
VPHSLDRWITPLVVALPAAALLGWPAAPSTSRTASAPPRVTVEGGVLEGAVDSATGVLVFRGIPYAAAPVGRLRWRPPQPAPTWRGVRAADRLGHNCMQGQPYGDIDPYAAGISEDCLNLNVWTSTLGSGGPRPVMVWIHGGGFAAGFGGEERHHGARLAQKGAVVVTLNYRLGAFGFLAHPALAAESPQRSAGNYGLLDQIAAQRWVQRNAARFGGDPSRVTIFGESAGGMSVGALVASPLARGLFQRAIMESGVGVGARYPVRDSALAQGRRFAARLGVEGDGADAAARLRALPADTLLARWLATSAPGGAPGERLRTQPIIDGWVLPRPVDSALARGVADRVPVIVGSNADESDEAFGAPARAYARLLTARGGRAYLYQFARTAQDSAGRRVGAPHASEITFVFGLPRPLLPVLGRAPSDSTLAEAMSDYWVAFATTGDPNGAPSAGRWPRWPAYDAKTDAYQELGAEIAPRTALRRAVYDSLDQAARARGEIRP